MPEYRRFIAYFYEYIDGKKGKNAGFAKVELRNGMWRILFRLTADSHPEPPVQVYGFVRERGWLLGLLMGTMRPGNAMMEEWAYQADVPLWERRYGFSDLAGIWIRSGDDRSYVTVWDDEPIRLEDFVTELPDAPEQTVSARLDMPTGIEMPGAPEQTRTASPDVPVEIETPGAPEQTRTTSPDVPVEIEMPGTPEEIPTSSPDVPIEIEMPTSPERTPTTSPDVPIEIEMPTSPERTPTTSPDIPVEIEMPGAPERTPSVSSDQPVETELPGKTEPEISRGPEPGISEPSVAADVGTQISMAQLSTARKENDSSAFSASAKELHANADELHANADGFRANTDGFHANADGFRASADGFHVSTDEIRAGAESRAERNEEGIAEAAVSAEMTADRSAVYDGAALYDGAAAQKETSANGEGKTDGETEGRTRAEAPDTDSCTYIWKELCQRRQHFEPFEDGQFSDCIRIMPCDLMQLQQAGWQVGRSTFLLHGFYQYHHLLFGVAPDGSYVLGVPGLMNAQERYMAQMFGFASFKTARWRDHGRQFGYWYRMLAGR